MSLGFTELVSLLWAMRFIWWLLFGALMWRSPAKRQNVSRAEIVDSRVQLDEMDELPDIDFYYCCLADKYFKTVQFY